MCIGDWRLCGNVVSGNGCSGRLPTTDDRAECEGVRHEATNDVLTAIACACRTCPIPMGVAGCDHGT